MKRLLWRGAVVCLALALLFGGCTTRAAGEVFQRENATPSPAPSVTPVPASTPMLTPTPSPTPTPCPHAVWTDGVCAACGAACGHPAWEEGRCAACGMACPHPSHDPETLRCTQCGLIVPHDFAKNVCVLCGEGPAFREKLLPRDLFKPCERQGTVEKVTYSSHVYYDPSDPDSHKSVQKTLYVYLPYGYDPEERYDVLVLLHGIACTEKYWLVDKQEYKPDSIVEVKTADLLDNMIDQGLCRKLIVVTPTFYENSKKMEEYWRQTDQPIFQREVRKEILPLIAEKYATYAESGSPEDISAARRHFGIAGLSMGSIYIYTGFLPDSLDLFGWFGCFSGSDGNMNTLAGKLNESEYPVYYFYNSVGRLDDYYDLHLGQYRSLLGKADGLAEGENAAFSVIEDVGHKYAAWSAGLYNFLQVAFSPSAAE